MRKSKAHLSAPARFICQMALGISVSAAPLGAAHPAFVYATSHVQPAATHSSHLEKPLSSFTSVSGL